MAGEYYDEEFIRDLKTGEAMMKQLRDRTEKEIIKKWMARVCKLKSSDIKVKKARNEFYKYLMELMKTALLHEKDIADETKTKKKQMSFKSTWSPDRRTYVAIQPLPNQGALIYMACNARPDLGWDVPAKKKAH